MDEPGVAVEVIRRQLERVAVTVKISGVRLNRKTGNYVAKATLTNTSSEAIGGPISLTVKFNEGGLALANASGITCATATTGLGFINATLTDNSLAAGASVELAFPDGERVAFEKEVLFPLAGLDPTAADRYYELRELLGRLDYSGNEAARDYLNGAIDREQAVQWLVDYSLSSPERARQRTDFFDTYRSYVINYNLGKDMVRDYVERDTEDLAIRWQRFEQLLSSPMSPADLQ